MTCRSVGPAGREGYRRNQRRESHGMDRTASGISGKVKWGREGEMDPVVGQVGWARKRDFWLRKWGWIWTRL